MQHLERHDRNLEVDPLWYTQPMKNCESRHLNLCLGAILGRASKMLANKPCPPSKKVKMGPRPQKNFGCNVSYRTPCDVLALLGDPTPYVDSRTPYDPNE